MNGNSSNGSITTEKPTVISLFTGGMGFDLGFEDQGFEIRSAVDRDPAVQATLLANRRNIPVITKDINSISAKEILDASKLEIGEPTVVTGAPPCEPFTTAGSRNGFNDLRANAVYRYIELINEIQPEYFAFEEVPGFTRAAKRHMSFYKRIKMPTDEIHPDFRLGSAFEDVMEIFHATGYHLSIDLKNPKASILNAADFGTPQTRRRFVLIGSRRGPHVELPQPTHRAPGSDGVARGLSMPWLTLRDALSDLKDPSDEHLEFPVGWGKYLPLVPPGGCWRDLPEHLHKTVLGGAYDDRSDALTAGKKGGRTGFLRRLSWDKPSPTLVDYPTTKASSLCHPDESRPLSVKEYARIQGFNDDWIFAGSLIRRYRLIGQATPVRLATAIAKQILKHRLGYLSLNGDHNDNRSVNSVPVAPLGVEIQSRTPAT